MCAVGYHWHAVQRDLLSMGFRAADMFTPQLSAAELISVIVAAPAGSAVRYAFDGGWSLTDHLLATDMEHRAGFIGLPGRVQRPGVPGESVSAKPAQNSFRNISEFEAHRAKVIKAKRNGRR